MPDINGIPYVESTDLVSAYPAASQALAQEVSDQLAAKGNISTNTGWTTFTPTGGGFTVGNGTIVGAWMKVGRLMSVEILFTLGSTSTITGDVSFQVPLGGVGTTPKRKSASNTALYLDSSAGIGFLGVAIAETSGNIFTRAIVANGTYGFQGTFSGTAPFTWATGDTIQISINYETSA